jgi:iron complex outermembrane receptor protein
MKNSLPVVLASLIAVVFCADPLLAQDLTGKILDPDGRAVPNASLRLYEKNSGDLRTTKSSSDGKYSFKGIAPGDYLLEADASDSALNGSKQISVTGNQSENLDLKVSGKSTEISVTANSTPLSVQDTGKAVDVIDATELALRNELAISEALRTLPGVRVQTAQGPGSFTEIKTRGLRAADTALLIDGMRFHDASSIQNDATGFFEDMMVVDTDRIEFLRGSGSSLYGSNALGGVVNVISGSGGGRPRGSLRVEGGGLGVIRGVANVGGGALDDRLTYSGGASHFYMTDGVRGHLPYRNNSVQGSGKYSFRPGISLTGRAWYSSNYLNSTETPTFLAAMPSNPNGEVEAIALPISELEKYETGQPYNVGNATFIPNAIDPDGRRQASFLSAMTVFQHQVSTNTSYRVGYQAVDTRRAFLDGPQGPGSFEPGPGERNNYQGYIDTTQARLDQRIGRHNLVSVGYEWEQEKYLTYDGGAYGSPSSNRVELRQRSHAIYVQDQVNLFDGRLQLTAAGRAQFFRLKDPEFEGFSNPYSNQISSLDVPTAYTGDGALAYFIAGSGTKLRAHVGNSFRAPSGYERFGSFFGSYYGDPRLAPERAIAVDGGIDQTLLDSKLEMSATVFYTNLQQIIGFGSVNNDPFGRASGYVSRPGGIARGFELSGRLSPTHNTKIFTSYTYTNSDSRTPTSGSNYYEVLDVSPHVFTVTAAQWLSRRTSVTFDMAAHSDYNMTLFGGLFGGQSRRFRFNGPVKADVGVRHDVPFGDDHSVEIYAKVENVFAQRPYEDGFIGPKAWVITGARVNF